MIAAAATAFGIYLFILTAVWVCSWIEEGAYESEDGRG